VRLFFALWPEADVVRMFEGVASRLSLHGSARLVAPESYHLTLAFIGEVGASSLVVLQQIGRTQRASCCSIAFGGLEHWPGPEIIVSTAQEFPSELYDLSAKLDRTLALHTLKAPSPSPAPPRPFRAHVTLARKVSQATVLPVMPSFTWSVNRFSLVSADTSGVQSVYTVLDTWPLLYET
jgi:2'-5' RNA ligase